MRENGNPIPPPFVEVDEKDKFNFYQTPKEEQTPEEERKIVKKKKFDSISDVD